MAMVCMEFGSLNELANAANNYHCNINTLYGDFEEYTMALDKVVCNIVVLMYSRYINLWPVNSTCVGHHALLMHSMLEFVLIHGRYCCCE